MTGITRIYNTANGNHTYRLDGQKVDGVTTILSGGIPKPALTSWAARETATFAIDHLALVGELERDAAIDLLKGAPWRDRDAAARRGTEVHALADQLLAGAEIDVPEELAGHVDSYIAFVRDWAPHCLMCEKPVPCGCGEEFVEKVVANRAYQYMGRLDAGFIFPTLGRTLTDIKTTRSGIYAETALQLAAYRYAETYLDDPNGNGIEYEMPPFDNCAALWVRADGYDLIPVEATEVQWRTFLYAQQIAQFTRTQDDARRKAHGGVIGDPLPPPPHAPRLEVVS